jgi:hypothetical protein
VIENYFPEVAALGVVMGTPSVEELPFFEEQKHEAPTEGEMRERADAYRACRENLRNDTNPGGERAV